MTNQWGEIVDNSPNATRSTKRPGLSRGIFIFLVVLSLGGVAIMDYSVTYGLWYWVAMSIISGGVSIGLAWRGAAEAGETAGGHLKKQVFHWLSLIGALLLIFFLQSAEALSPTVSGLMALLMLALTTVLAGVHFRPRLAVLGGIQIATFVAAVITEEFFWVLLILILIAVVIDIVWRSRKR
ncbi:MAG: hypothetical protein QNL91_04420 [Candidatus Krumholzibacteria bacterium]|nr:hypothetical protein [Candidatus Krumholzibacteria bacterium]